MKRYKSQLNEANESLVNINNDTPIVFGKLEIGDNFHNSVSKNAGIHSNTYQWQEFSKISKSKAKCVNQIGYGNTRAVGNIYTFAYNAIVYLF
jgi:hypothetical protein